MSCYEKIILPDGRWLTVVEAHHQSLSAWADFRRERECSGWHRETAYAAVVLDHHTDVVKAFRDDTRRSRIEPGAWRNPEQVATAVAELRHDEHFDYALCCKLLTRVVIVAEVNATPVASAAMNVRCDAAFPEECELLNHGERYRELLDGLLEDDFLERQLGDWNFEEPYILDIDCDYFLTREALFPKHGRFFDRLIRGAEMISIARESDYVRLLQLPQRERGVLSADEIVEILKARILSLSSSIA